MVLSPDFSVAVSAKAGPANGRLSSPNPITHVVIGFIASSLDMNMENTALRLALSAARVVPCRHGNFFVVSSLSCGLLPSQIQDILSEQDGLSTGVEQTTGLFPSS